MQDTRRTRLSGVGAIATRAARPWPIRVAAAAVVGAGTWLGLAGTVAAQECWHPTHEVQFVAAGDLTGTGHVNVADALCSVMLSLTWAQVQGGAPPPACLDVDLALADLDCDGSVTVSDITLVIHLAISGLLPAAVDPEQTGCHAECQLVVPVVAGFWALGDLPGGVFFSQAFGVNGDGTRVVGHSSSGDSNPYEGFLWTAEHGMVGLGYLPNGTKESVGRDISDAGDVIVGRARHNTLANHHMATRWTVDANGVASAPIATGQISGACGSASATASQLLGISRDGGTLVGSGLRDNSRPRSAFWRPGAGWSCHVDPPGYGNYSWAFNASADGSVIVGWGFDGWNYTNTQAYRWSPSDGITLLGDLPGGALKSIPYAVSADGTVIVGQGTTAQGTEAVRWTYADGVVTMESLGYLGGDTVSANASAISDDGQRIVGGSQSPDLGQAFVYEDTIGMVRLADLLEAGGVDVTGWRLATANAISANGEYIAGNAVNPDGHSEAFLAYLPR